MKVIGTVKDHGFLLQADRDEIANLIGYYWHGQDSCPRIEVGMSIEVSKMFGQLYGMATRSDELVKKAREIRAIADILEMKCPLYTPAVLEEPGAPKVGS